MVYSLKLVIPYFTVPKGINRESTENYWYRWKIAFTDESLKIRITHTCWNVDRGTVANQESGIQKTGTVLNNMRSLARWDSSAFYQDSRQFFVSGVLTITSFYGSRSKDYCRSCITPRSIACAHDTSQILFMHAAAALVARGQFSLSILESSILTQMIIRAASCFVIELGNGVKILSSSQFGIRKVRWVTLWVCSAYNKTTTLGWILLRISISLGSILRTLKLALILISKTRVESVIQT